MKLDLKANKNFFLHHHKLFFAKRAIFVEGPNDLLRYSAFCVQYGNPDLLKDIYIMGGYSNFGIYQSVCIAFNVPLFAVFDLDVI